MATLPTRLSTSARRINNYNAPGRAMPSRQQQQSPAQRGESMQAGYRPRTMQDAVRENVGNPTQPQPVKMPQQAPPPGQQQSAPVNLPTSLNDAGQRERAGGQWAAEGPRTRADAEAAHGQVGAGGGWWRYRDADNSQQLQGRTIDPRRGGGAQVAGDHGLDERVRSAKAAAGYEDRQVDTAALQDRMAQLRTKARTQGGLGVSAGPGGDTSNIRPQFTDAQTVSAAEGYAADEGDAYNEMLAQQNAEREFYESQGGTESGGDDASYGTTSQGITYDEPEKISLFGIKTNLPAGYGTVTNVPNAEKINEELPGQVASGRERVVDQDAYDAAIASGEVELSTNANGDVVVLEGSNVVPFEESKWYQRYQRDQLEKELEDGGSGAADRIDAEELIAAQRAARAGDFARNIRASMEAGARSGMGAEGMSGLQSMLQQDMTNKGNLADEQTRMQTNIANMQRDIDMYKTKAARLMQMAQMQQDVAMQNKMIAAAKEAAAQAQSFEAEMMRLQMQAQERQALLGAIGGGAFGLLGTAIGKAL